MWGNLHRLPMNNNSLKKTNSLYKSLKKIKIKIEIKIKRNHRKLTAMLTKFIVSFVVWSKCIEVFLNIFNAKYDRS